MAWCNRCGDTTEYCNCDDGPDNVLVKSIQKIYPNEKITMGGTTYYSDSNSVNIGGRKLNFYTDEAPNCCGVTVVHSLTTTKMLPSKAGKILNILAESCLKNNENKIAQYYSTSKQTKVNAVLKAAKWKNVGQGKNPRHNSTINVWMKVF